MVFRLTGDDTQIYLTKDTSIAAAATAAIILMDFFSMMYSSLCSIIGTRFTCVHSSNPLQLR